MEITGKNIVVTGGGNGIGKALCERFAAEGAAHVMVVDLDLDNAEKVAGSIGAKARRIDVGDRAQVVTLVRDVEADTGPIDLFVSNAGFVTIGGLEAANEELQRMWEVHVLAHMIAARAVIPGMVERGEGYILSTASAAGLLSQFASLHYAVTKRAAIALAEWISITHGHQGIKVSVLCPQAVQTNITENSPDRAKMEGGTGIGVASADGVLEPADVAQVVIDAMREEHFHILPHPEVAEYVKRKGADVDRWLGGMQRWQGTLFPGDAHPANWLTKPKAD